MAAPLLLTSLLALQLAGPPAPAPFAPLASYPLDGDARDETGGGPPCVVQGARPAEDRAGRPGGALAFGGRDLVDCGTRQEPERFTLAAWVRPERLREAALISKASPAAGRDRRLELGFDGEGRPVLWVPSLDRPLRGPRLLSERRWTHLAATFDGARAVLYADGAPVADAPVAPFRASPGPALLGARPDASGRLPRATAQLTGRLDEARLYRVALPAWEVLALVHPGSRQPPGGGEVADDAADLERVGRLAVAFDRAVVRRDRPGLREVEARVLGEAEQELREALQERGDRRDRGRRGEGRAAVARQVRETFQAEAGRFEPASLDRKRAALAALSEAAWRELMDELGEGPRDGRLPGPRDDGDGHGHGDREDGDDRGWSDRRDPGPPPAPAPPAPPPPAAGPRPMDPPRFEALVGAMRREPFPDGQLRVLDTAAPGAWFTVEQVGRLVDLVTFPDRKLDVVRRTRDRLVDPEESFRLYERFTFESDRRELRKILSP